MGGASSVLDFNVWTEDEKAANNKCIEMQRRMSEFIIKYFFYGVLVKIGKKSEDPQSPAWLEVDIDAMQQEIRKQNSSLLAQVDMKLLNTVPSGVSIDGKGRIKVIFNNSNLTYDLMADDIDAAIAYASGKEHVPIPDPPLFEEAGTNFIKLKWEFKQPVGITQKVEIQFVTLFASTAGLRSSEMSGLHRRSLHWQTLVVKSWELQNFSSHMVENLTPGVKLHFRVRVKNHLGWSEYSAPSEVMYTRPDRPSTPNAPVVQVATPTAVQLRWSRPKRSNGATVSSYILRGKGVGDEFAELYKGPMTSHLVMDLHPEYAYLFEVAAVNAIGTSDFSISTAVTTPSRMKNTGRRSYPGDDEQNSDEEEEEEQQLSPQMKAALESKEAWIECWDPRSEKYFYFNRLVGKRQIDRPQCLGPERDPSDAALPDSANPDGDDGEEPTYDPTVLKKHEESEFRKKRFRLIRAIHLHNQQTGKSPAASRTPGRSSISTNASAAGTPATPTTPVAVTGRGTGCQTAAEASPSTSRSNPDTGANNTGNSGNSHSVQKEPFVIELRRNTLLADAFRILHNKASLQQLGRRLKITFKGEEGIDSGGLGKEAFLLISRESAFFGGPINKHWLRYLSDAPAAVSAPPSAATDSQNASPSAEVEKSKSSGLTATQRALLHGGYFFCEETTPAATQMAKTASVSVIAKKQKKPSRQGSLTNIIANMDVLGRLQENKGGNSKDKYAEGDNGMGGDGKGNEGDVTLNGRKAAVGGLVKGLSKRIHKLGSSASASAQERNLRGSLRHMEDALEDDEQTQGQGVGSKSDEPENKSRIKSRRQLMNITASIKVLDEEEHITRVKFAQFLGRFIGKAIYDRQLIDIPLASILYKHMVGDVAADVTDSGSAPLATAEEIDWFPDPISDAARPRMTKRMLQCLNDMRSLDIALYRSLLWMLNNDITYIIDETFSVPSGEKTVALCKDGEKREVDEENKFEYVELITRWKTTFSVASMLNPFLQSFHEIVPLKCLKEGEISAAEIALMLNGKPEIDIEELRAYCVFQGGKHFNEQDEVVLWLWQALRDMDDGDRRNFLKFFTGSSRIPLDGFDPPINITEGVDMAVDSLPKAHTCFNQLVLPRYSSYQRMKDRLIFAMNNTEGFALS